MLISLRSATAAQDDTVLTPSPISPPTVLSSSNLGSLQPLDIPEILQRTNLSSWRDAGLTGEGRRIGVLDRGFGGLLEFEERTSVSLLTAGEVEDYTANPVFHGTQVAEVVQSIAPNAQLLLCEYVDLGSYIACIDWMMDTAVNIIVHSAGVPALPLDGSSPWAQAVDHVTDEGVLWINAAGNFARGRYRDVLTDTDEDRLHEFREVQVENELLRVPAIETDQQGIVMLSWESVFERDATAIDLNLRVLDSQTETVIAESNLPQNGEEGQQALEFIIIDLSRDFAVQVIDTNGNAVGTEFVLFVEFTTLPNGIARSSIITPGDAAGSLTVGALQSIEAAPYSSQGPLENGQPEPDIATYGEIRLDSGSRFVGTSAAAPVIAGAAALIWEANPTFTNEEVRTFLLNSAQGITEFDPALGQGRILMPDPFEDIPEEPALTAVTPTPMQPITPSQQALPGCEVTTLFGVNLREQPTVNSTQLGSRAADTIIFVDGRIRDNADFIWWRVGDGSIDNGLWVREDLVSESADCDTVPFVQP